MTSYFEVESILHPAGCETCEQHVQSAVVMARATGSVAFTYETQNPSAPGLILAVGKPGEILHQARVRRIVNRVVVS